MVAGRFDSITFYVSFYMETVLALGKEKTRTYCRYCWKRCWAGM